MVGTWNVVNPDGSKSVKKNETIGQNNTTYIKANANLDHYWADSDSTDGYHRQASMTKKSADPTLLLGSTDGMFYVRNKTATEAPDRQLPEPYYYHTPDVGTTKYYQQLGTRAMVHFEVGLASGGHAITIKYSHNVASVTRNGTGLFTVNFTNDMPTVNYIPSGVAMRRASGTPSGSNALFIAPLISNTKGDSFKVGSFVFKTWSSSDSPKDPSVVTLSIVGG